MAAELLVEGTPDEVAEKVYKLERELKLNVRLRLGDPNMLRSPSGVKREVTWQQEFADAGLLVDLADDSDVGRGRLNEFLQPTEDQKAPRLHIHKRCTTAISQFKRYIWDDFRSPENRDLKQVPKDKNDDFPSMLKYHMNALPTFTYLTRGAPVIHARR